MIPTSVMPRVGALLSIPSAISYQSSQWDAVSAANFFGSGKVCHCQGQGGRSGASVHGSLPITARTLDNSIGYSGSVGSTHGIRVNDRGDSSDKLERPASQESQVLCTSKREEVQNWKAKALRGQKRHERASKRTLYLLRHFCSHQPRGMKVRHLYSSFKAWTTALSTPTNSNFTRDCRGCPLTIRGGSSIWPSMTLQCPA
jgi:hypothetical protein